MINMCVLYHFCFFIGFGEEMSALKTQPCRFVFVAFDSIQAVAQAKADAAPREEEQPQEPEEVAQVVPDGFEMVEINGRMVLRMK